jgi:hypothetical protein
MFRAAKLWCLFVLIAAASLTAGYVLPRPQAPNQGRDVLDAVAAVQRRIPLNLIPEPAAPYNWVEEGGIYLSRTRKTPEELDRLPKDPARFDDRWQGVVYFKAGPHRGDVRRPFMPADGEHALDYGTFAVFGDPKMIQQVHSILAEQGFDAVAP